MRRSDIRGDLTAGLRVFSCLDDGFALVAAVLVEDDLPDAVGDDLSAEGVLYAVDGSLDVGVDLGILEGEVTPFHRAVLEDQALRIAEGLRPADFTVDKAQILRVPCEIFALDDAVIDCDVLGLPKGILGIEDAIVDRDVLTILEGILSVEGDIAQDNVFTMEKEVFSRDLGILDRQVAAKPTEFRADGVTARDCDVLTFPHRLDPEEVGILNADILRIPERGTAGIAQGAVRDLGIRHMPKGIAQSEVRGAHGDVVALLQGRFPVGRSREAAILNGGVGECIEGALFVKGCFSDLFHDFLAFVIKLSEV